MKVAVRRRTRGLDETVEEVVDWPEGWPLPAPGTIVLGKKVGGWLEHIEFDLVKVKVIVVLRP